MKSCDKRIDISQQYRCEMQSAIRVNKTYAAELFFYFSRIATKHRTD